MVTIKDLVRTYHLGSAQEAGPYLGLILEQYEAMKGPGDAPTVEVLKAVCRIARRHGDSSRALEQMADASEALKKTAPLQRGTFAALDKAEAGAMGYSGRVTPGGLKDRIESNLLSPPRDKGCYNDGIPCHRQKLKRK